MKKAFLLLCALLAGGHVIIEDIPGVGKTTLASALSKSSGLTFGRVQFTPDVTASDITGYNIFNRKTGDFEFRETFCLPMRLIVLLPKRSPVFWKR